MRYSESQVLARDATERRVDKPQLFWELLRNRTLTPNVPVCSRVSEPAFNLLNGVPERSFEHLGY